MQKKHLITSALPYINGIKHLGNLVGSLLPADVYAKFLRQNGEDVLYICGTDEHGTPAEIAAKSTGKTIADYCADMYETQKSIYENFGITFDYFGRSSAPSNHQITQDIYKNLKANNMVFETEIQQYYSPKDGRFLPDRYVEGTCYLCHAEKARGDQCDACGALLEPEKLINPYSTISGSTDIHLKSTKHIFLDLPKLESVVDKWTQSRAEWPDVVKGIAKKWIKEGLNPRCITRDLKWGVPVPENDFDDKVFYVWFDAPNAYISMTKDWAESRGTPDDWKSWWLPNDDVNDSSNSEKSADDDSNPKNTSSGGSNGSEAVENSVRYTQFMAKDNVAFHAIFWPAMLFGADMGYKQVDYIKGFHWLTYEKGKFSTSQKRGIFTDTALKLYPSDYWRYYLIANCPETSDADFSFESFANTVNKDLADVLGNFCNRTLSLMHKYYDGRVTKSIGDCVDASLQTRAQSIIGDLYTSSSDLKFRQAAQNLRALWVLGNEYISEKEPWSLAKTDPDAACDVLIHCVHMLRTFAICAYPITPETSQKILNLLNDDTDLKTTSIQNALNFSAFEIGHTFQKPERLFEKIDHEAVETLTQQYAGT